MWWLLLLLPLAIIVFILFLKVRLCLVYEESLSVHLKIMLFKYPLFPQKQEKVKAKDYSLKKLEKKQSKLKKKSKNKEESIKTNQEKDKATQIKDILEIVKIVLENVMSPFGRYLKVEVVKLYVKIATDDAAKTAVIYGVASQTVAYIIEILSNITNVDVKRKNSIQVIPDFLSEKSEAKINITLGLRGWHALSLATKFFTYWCSL